MKTLKIILLLGLMTFLLAASCGKKEPWVRPARSPGPASGVWENIMAPV